MSLQTRHLLQQPAPLQPLAARALARRLARALAAGRAQHCYLPRAACDRLVHDTLAYLQHSLAGTELDTLRPAVHVLFSDRLTSLPLNSPRYVLIRDFLCDKSHTLTGLVRLELKLDRPFRDDAATESDVIRILTRLHGLRYLTAINVSTCPANILTCIADNCALIEELYLYPSPAMTDSMEPIARLTHLKSINMETITRRALMQYFKRIEHIVAGPRDVVWRFISYYLSSYDGEDTFRLKSYKSIIDRREPLQKIFRACPRIQTLAIFGNRRRNNLYAIEALTDLRDLTVTDYDCGRIRKVLRMIGFKLEHLQMRQIERIDAKTLIDVSQTCPNLESLSFRACKFKKERRPWTRTEELVIAPFRNLKNLTLGISRDWYSDSTYLLKTGLVFLFTECLNIEYLEFTGNIILTDDLMLNILNMNPLTYLKELKITQSSETIQRGVTPLSSTVLDRIARNSIHRPIVTQVLPDPP